MAGNNLVNRLSSNSPQTGIPKFVAGSARSVGRLKILNFDPIGELVHKYRDLEKELERQKQIRNGEVVELTAAGKPKSHNPEIMLAIYDKQVNIAEKLLRYRYGRVPEVDDGRVAPPAALIVNLTKKGETYVVNEEQPDGTIENQDDDSDAYEQSRGNRDF